METIQVRKADVEAAAKLLNRSGATAGDYFAALKEIVVNAILPLACQMTLDCKAEVTHIGTGGWVYCTEHAIQRRAHRYEGTRKMTAKELRTVQSGTPIVYYK